MVRTRRGNKRACIIFWLLFHSFTLHDTTASSTPRPSPLSTEFWSHFWTPTRLVRFSLYLRSFPRRPSTLSHSPREQSFRTTMICRPVLQTSHSYTHTHVCIGILASPLRYANRPLFHCFSVRTIQHCWPHAKYYIGRLVTQRKKK